MPRITFTCPQCACPFFGTYNNPGGSKLRFCKGPVEGGVNQWTCTFTWPVSEDAKWLKAEGQG
jgi:hypothetical protein